MVQETKGVYQIEIDSYYNYCMTTNNPNPIREEKGDRRIIYFETNNAKFGDEQYFNELCKPFQPVRQGEYDKHYMGVLLHYMLTQIDVSSWNPERLIRDINARTDVEYNENLERQYEDLNAIDKYVVDHAKLFKRGISLEEIDNIGSYKRDGIAKKLRATCVCVRMSAKKYIETIAHDDHDSIYKEKVHVFSLKPAEQIPDLYAIVAYKEHQEILLDEWF